MSRPSRFPHNGLIELRHKAGLTQACAAARCGVSQVVFYCYEISRQQIPSTRLADVARVLGCSVAEVVAATAVDIRPEQGEQPIAAPRYIDPANPNGWRLQDEDSRDGQARFEAWAEAEAVRTVVAAQTRWNARYAVKVTS